GRRLATGSLPIPAGLRDVIGRRLSRLSPTSNRLLAVAAVAGREFRLDVVQQVAGIAEAGLDAALEEATRAAVLEERGVAGPDVTYRFTHAFFRQTLYEELIAPRRIRLHRQVGRALEAIHAAHADDYAGTLAEHFAHSSDPT